MLKSLPPVIPALWCDRSPAMERSHPNLLLILTDDMGSSDIDCDGGRDSPTPHIDRRAAEGLRFTSADVAAPRCGPARMGLLSGTFPARFGAFNMVFAPEQKPMPRPGRWPAVRT
jgi:arylsulfatase A